MKRRKGVCVCVCGKVEGRVGGEAEGVIVVGQRGLDRGRKKKTILINACESKLRALFLSVTFLAV